MGLFSKDSVATTPGRALVAPASTGRAGQHDDNVNNFSANAAVKCKVGLEPLTAEGRGELQSVEARLPNWLRMVLYAAGTNHDIGPSLPDQLEVPVLMESGTSRIVSIDVDATAAELARYREVGRREWRETEAVLAPVRQAIQMPGAAVRGAKGLLGSLRGTAKELSPKEIEQMRRTAAQQRLYFNQRPKEKERYRESVLGSAPMMVESYNAGTRTQSDWEAWLMTMEVSEILTADEVAGLRRETGL